MKSLGEVEGEELQGKLNCSTLYKSFLGKKIIYFKPTLQRISCKFVIHAEIPE